MATKNTSVSIYLPRYHFSTQTPQGYAGNISQSPRVVGRIYRQLSPKSRKTMSRCDSNDNIRALLGYIKKKRKTGKPARRRRSFPKQSSKRSRRKSPRRDESTDEVALAQIPVHNLVKKVLQ